MSNVNTTVTVSAQAKGFQQAQAAATKLTKAVKEGTDKISSKKFQTEMHHMEHSLQKVAKKQLALNDAMKGMSKGSAEEAKLSAQNGTEKPVPTPPNTEEVTLTKSAREIELEAKLAAAQRKSK